jgi:uncharacterized protein (TIGR03086 family)
MGLDLPELHARALDATRRIVVGVDAAQWHDDTPCPPWDVRELVNHVVTGNWWAAELAAGATIESVGDRLDGDVLGDDPPAAYDASAAAAAAVFRVPGAMEAPCHVSYGPVPGEVYCGHRYIDVLVHGWDAAVATRQSAELDPDLVDACLAVVEPQIEQLTGSGAFGTTVELGPGADAQARLLAMLGRDARIGR